MSAQAPSPAASGTVSSPSVNASSPSSNGSVPGSNSSPPPQQIQPSTPPSTSSPPPASSPPPPSTNPTTPPPGSPPPVSSPPPSSSKATPPSPSPPAQSPPPAANAQPPAGSPPPPANAPPPAQSPPSPVNAPPPAKSSPPPVNAPPPAQSPPPPANVSPPAQSPPQNLSPPPKSSPTSPPPSIKPSTPPPAESPSKSTTTPPSIVSPPSSSPSPPSSLSSPPTSSPTQNSPSPKESPPSPETPTPAGIPSPPSLTLPGTGSSSSPTPNSTLAGGTSSSSSSGNVPIAAIAGIAVGALVVLAVFGVLFRYIRKKQRRDNYPGNYYAPAPPGSISRKSDGVYASNSPNSDQYFVQASPSTVIPGYGYDNGHQGSKYSSGDAIGVPAQVATSGLGNSKSWFTYEELAIATNGFSPQNVLGEGGFGCVYKGYLEGGKVVAVKQLKIGGGQGEREFRAEVDIISRVHHRHLVSLVGYCIADSQRLLVYEYVPNGTLEYHLHGRGRPVMDWPTRLRIAVGAARGIAYLHEDCHPRIIHRDIKSANILLDDRFEAQVSDFGLAKLALDAHTHVTTRVMGTFGYMAPEYASSGKLTQRSDVFSFGVVLLEFVTGRKPVDTSQPLGDESLVEWARPLLSHALEEGNFEALVDPRLENNFNQGEMFRMIEAAAACVRHSAQRRPRMGQVVRALESDAAMADLNNGVKPGQSTMYNSAQYSADIRRFRRMAFGSQDVGSDFSGVSSEYDMNPSTSSSEYHKSKEVEAKLSRHLKTDLESASGSEYQSSESETRPINISRSHKDETGERSSGELPTNFRGQSLKGR